MVTECAPFDLFIRGFCQLILGIMILAFLSMILVYFGSVVFFFFFFFPFLLVSLLIVRQVDGEKMAKSKGNFVTMAQAVE